MSLIFAVIVCLSALACVAQGGQIVLGEGQSDYAPFNTGFDSFIEGLLDEWHTPGIAIAVVYQNQTWAKGYGHAILPNVPVTPYTLFQGASTTKSFTASLAALLVDDDKLFKHVDWSTPLHDLVGNDFVLSDPYLTQHVTLQDALSHRTGIPRHDAVWLNNQVNVEEETHALRHLPPSAEFRTKWQYCNLMFTAVSHTIQTLTKKWHGIILREWLWEPLGMEYSYYSYEDAYICEELEPECKMAVGYAWNNKSRKHEAIDRKSYHDANGAGGVISNVLDYSRWLRALIYEHGPVSKAGHAAIKTPSSVEAFEKYPYSGPVWYGMGLEGGIYRNIRVFGHGGAIGGYYSHFSFLPDKEWGYVAFQNTPGSIVDIAGWRLLDEFLGTPRDEFAQMNRHFRNATAEMERKARTLPSELYPDVTPTPVKPALPLESYAGTYNHPSYGFLNVSCTPPVGVVSVPPPLKGAIERLYSKSKHENMLYTFSHVSGEHWIVGIRSHVHNSEVADDYTKARFDVSPAGRVSGLNIVVEKSVEGEKGWAKFQKADLTSDNLHEVCNGSLTKTKGIRAN